MKLKITTRKKSFLIALLLISGLFSWSSVASNLSDGLSSFDASLTEPVWPPELLSPTNRYLYATTVSEVVLNWSFSGQEFFEVEKFRIEYKINATTGSVEVNGTTFSWTLTGLGPASAVQWRICAVGSEQTVCSNWFEFAVKRDRPVYVSTNGTGTGSSWVNAASLQYALTNAILGDELWLQRGTYKPTAANDRSISFRIHEGVKLYGGFVGTETALVQRNWLLNPTVLSGDIGVEGNHTDNSYNVVWMEGTFDLPITNNTLIDGVTITGGYADLNSSNRERGAALQLINASPIIVNVVFRDNYALNFGGAVHGNTGSTAHFYNTVFHNNSVGRFGGAVLANNVMRFYNTVFFGNRAGERGGAVNGPSNYVLLDNSIVWGNNAPAFPQLFNVIASYSIIEGGILGVGILNEDPGFLNGEKGDFRLNMQSPALNKGSNDLVPGWLTTDLAGNPRILDGTIDIGVYEGSKITPFPSSPVKDFFFGSDVTQVQVQWQWPTEAPEHVTSYSVEVRVNDVPSVFFTADTDHSATVTGLYATDRVNWRVGAVYASGEEAWSPWTRFFIKRNTPLYVKPGGTGDGNSWNSATNLQNALEMAVYGDQIWVAAGIYYPTNGTDQTISFVVKDGVRLYGGFAGVETSLSERKILNNKTILSGDIGVKDNLSDNSYHVLTARGTSAAPITNATLIDGFVIEYGFAATYTGNNQHAGGLYLLNASPRVVNCWFRNNHSRDRGGAVFGDNASNPVFANVIFSHNNSQHDGGAVFSNSAMTFHNCLWYSNNSAYWGGAISASTNNTTNVYNSISWGNRAAVNFNDFRNVRVRNSLVEDGSGIGSLTANPKFVDADNFDFRLQAESPALNTGLNQWVPAWLTHDITANNRIVATIVDMGPFEFTDETNSINDLLAHDRFLVWPNPMKRNEELNLELMASGHGLGLTIWDLSGQKILSIDQVDFSGVYSFRPDLSSGVYFIEIGNASGKRLIQKLIVE